LIHGEIAMPPVITDIAIVAFVTVGAVAPSASSLLPATQFSGVAFRGALVAQATPTTWPDFAGAWTMDKDRSEAALQGQPIGDVFVAITLAGPILNVETTRDGKAELVTYPIGEPPSATSEVSGERRAFWDGLVLIDQGSVDVNGQTVGYREARTLSGDGAEMVVETTLKIEHGYELNGAQTVVTGKNVFVRRR
jgi:hypothetical protein